MSKFHLRTAEDATRAVDATSAPGRAPLRIYYVHPLLAGPLSQWPAHLDRARAMRFSHVCSAPIFAPAPSGDVFLTDDHELANPAILLGSAEALARGLAEHCRKAGVELLLDLVLDRIAADGAMARSAPHWFHREGTFIDPRKPLLKPDAVPARFDDPARVTELAGWWIDKMVRLVRSGVAGFRLLGVAETPPSFLKSIIDAVRQEVGACKFLAWTPGLTPSQLAALEGVGLDAVFASTAWWDGHESWFADEQNALRRVAPAIGVVEAPFGERIAARGDPAMRARLSLRIAAATGQGLLIPMGFEFGARTRMDARSGTPEAFAHERTDTAFDLTRDIAAANQNIADAQDSGVMRAIPAPGEPVSALAQFDTGTDRTEAAGRLILINTGASARPLALDHLLPAAGAVLGDIPMAEAQAPIASGEVRVLPITRAKPVSGRSRRSDRLSLTDALKASRLAIENITPSVDDGAFPVKRIVGRPVAVEVDLIGDGHDIMAGELLWKAADEKNWTRAPLAHLGNDRWQASFIPTRTGRHVYAIEAWRDDYASLVHEIEVKHKAGVDIALELIEAREYLEEVKREAERGHAAALGLATEALRAGNPADAVHALASPSSVAAVAASATRAFLAQSPQYALEAERIQAEFASWYELFPRSQSGDASRHGTFDDVIRRLPEVRQMGFDVLYFPPIHPIGKKNRKGRNNTLTPGPEDVGSPYAIGSDEGGHDAIHPQLGTLEDFRRLVAAARENGLEIALDFAIQCSPDHPWLKDHPDWFKWRPDGTIKYAENPPKKYQDIVNVDFYGSGAPALWTGLRDVVLFWANEGVRLFRVDNPHTKPLPFWQWMIAEVRAQYPDAIFLSEAFTRPKMMYRLAKVGYSQSYTYFTWRNTKQELTEYLVELSTTNVKEFFRPHFFVNTPDINPYFLQTSGRGGFLIRAALAATLSGLWGVYAGFEICEGAPLPGREEYLDSEKYEIRIRDQNAPGNIVGEITKLNALRRAHPALQSHLNITFYNAFNDNILLYGKRIPGQQDMILVAVSLDPHHVQEAAFELPLWEWKLPDHGSLHVEDLMRGGAGVWNGKMHHMRLDPRELPFAIWRLSPVGGTP